MKLMSYRIDRTPHYGVVVDDGIVALDGRLPEADLDTFVAHGDLNRARHIAAENPPDHRLTDAVFLPPIARPGKIWCVGVNYADRNEEYKDGSDLPPYPSLFCRAATSFVGHDQPLERPRVSEQLDYEGEIAFVVGRAGRHVPRAQAWKHIFGLTLCNEGTVRDWLRHGKFNVTQGKNFDRSGSIGPWLVTADAFDPEQALEVTTHVNDELRQQDTTDRLRFPFDFLIEYLTTFATLMPGDVVITGTPAGAGARSEPPQWLKPGDEIRVSVPEIGVLRNTVIDEPS